MDEEDNKVVRKRKSIHDHEQEIVENPRNIHPHFIHAQDNLLGFNNVDLNLSVISTPQQIQPQPQPELPLDTITLVGGPSSRRRGSHSSRSSGGRTRAIVKTNSITPPYPWATDRRATLQSMEYLVSHGITTITGDLQCKKCETSFVMEYDLQEKFRELVIFILDEDNMSQRAHEDWIKPTLPTCRFCGEENSCKPLIAEKKKNINWLFLLLGQLLGCCTLEQLKYFCKHTHNHRTGAKDRVLFLSYYTLCRQLDPNGPYHF